MERITSFKNRLRIAMEARDITQSELCRQSGISTSSMSNYIAGRFEPKSDKLYQMAKALNVSEAWLMGLDTEMERQDEGVSPTFRSDEAEVEEYLEMLRTRPECRILLKTAKGATRQQVEENVRFIEAMRKARK